MNLVAKEIVITNFNIYSQNDDVKHVSTQMVKRNEDILFVKGIKGEVIGYCSVKDLLKGVLSGTDLLKDLVNLSFTTLLKTSLVDEQTFSKDSIAIVVNDKNEMTGYITKKHHQEYFMQIELEDNKKIKQIFDATHNGILAIDVEGRISALNPAAIKMAKTTQEGAVGNLLTEIVLNQGLMKVIRSGEGHSEKYTAGKSKYLAHRTPIYEGKKLVGAVGVFQKLSEVENVSEELNVVQNLKKEINLILDALPEGICITDKQGNLIKKNLAFREKYISLLENIDQATVYRKAIESVIEMKEILNVKIASLALQFIPLKNKEGELERIICVILDGYEIDRLKQQNMKKDKLMERVINNQYKSHVISKSKVMKNIVKKVNQICQLDIPVCISGEKGVDTRGICYDIIQKGDRKDKPIIEFFCEQYSSDEQKEILFGKRKGNKDNSVGLLEYLDGGNLIIHRLDKMDVECQNDFLNFLKGQQSDIRILVTTEVQLEDLIATKVINEELYYLLSVYSIYLPPLSERTEDIDGLVDKYLSSFEMTHKKNISISSGAKKIIQQKYWKQNEHELFNALNAAYLLCNSNVIDEDLLQYIFSINSMSSLDPIVIRKVLPLKIAVEELEKQLILKVKDTEKSYRKIAKILDVDASTIARKLKRIEESEMEAI